MIKVFNSVREMNTPVLLHVFTDKSKTFLDTQHDAIKSYSLSSNKLIKFLIKKLIFFFVIIINISFNSSGFIQDFIDF